VAGSVNTVEQALTTTQTRYGTTLNFVPTANFISDYKNAAPMSVRFGSASHTLASRAGESETIACFR
jgi:hypothetical protein